MLFNAIIIKWKGAGKYVLGLICQRNEQRKKQLKSGSSDYFSCQESRPDSVIKNSGVAGEEWGRGTGFLLLSLSPTNSGCCTRSEKKLQLPE